MPRRGKQQQPQAGQKFFVLECRKNMGQQAAYKRVSTRLERVAEFKTFAFARQWVAAHGDTGNVYFINRTTKLAWDKDRGWHETAYRQEVQDGVVVRSGHNFARVREPNEAKPVTARL